MLLQIFMIVLIAAGLEASDLDNRNQSIECSFKEIGYCFNLIANLGGNFSAYYAQQKTELNNTCQNNIYPRPTFPNCIYGVPSKCNMNKIPKQINETVLFVQNVCKNNSVEQNTFLNSSVCYNKYQSRRKNCLVSSKTSKDDAKSLCCQNKKIQDCLKKDLNICEKKYNDFQNKLIDTYSSYTNMLCQPYKCSATSNFVSLLCLFLTLKVAIVNWM